MKPELEIYGLQRVPAMSAVQPLGQSAIFGLSAPSLRQR
jgi:hypothetical protein